MAEHTGMGKAQCPQTQVRGCVGNTAKYELDSFKTLMYHQLAEFVLVLVTGISVGNGMGSRWGVLSVQHFELMFLRIRDNFDLSWLSVVELIQESTSTVPSNQTPDIVVSFLLCLLIEMKQYWLGEHHKRNSDDGNGNEDAISILDKLAALRTSQSFPFQRRKAWVDWD